MPYDGDPQNSDSDAVRMLLRDTSTSASILTDNEVNWLLDTHSSVYLAAAAGADMLASQYADAVVSERVGDLSLVRGSQAGDVASQYRKLGQQYRAQAARSDPFTPYSGGISRDDKQTQRDDTDWDKVDVALKQDDNRYRSESTDGIWRGY